MRLPTDIWAHCRDGTRRLRQLSPELPQPITHPHKSRTPVVPCRLSTGPGPIRQDGTVRWRSRQGGHINRHEGLATALGAAGFWAGWPSRDGVRLRDEVAQGASPVTGLAGRGWRADRGGLARGGVSEIL